MEATMNFKRREVKYLLTAPQRERLMQLFAEHMVPDQWGASTVCNVYFDTPDQLLIRRSIDKPDYKEKIRARSYGPAKEGGEVFLELKKKYDGIVYKRRCTVTLEQLDAFIAGTYEPKTQIEREIAFAIKRYEGLFGYTYLAYDREAFYGANDPDFRVTFDRNIRFRTSDVRLDAGTQGEQLLPEGTSLMEIKAAEAIPAWLVAFMTEEGISKVSFSKYGTAYARMFERGETAWSKVAPRVHRVETLIFRPAKQPRLALAS